MASGATQWPKAVFYDSKNTLFDWSGVWLKASENILRKYGSTVNAEEFKKTWHRLLIAMNHVAAFSGYRDTTDFLRDSLVYALKVHDVPGSAEDVREMTDRWNEVRPFPDTLQALKEQQRFAKVLVFSNVETRYLKMMVDKVAGFEPDFVGDMQMAGTLKPSPRAYRWVLEKNGLQAGEVLYAARPQWDVQGAMACGMKAVWVNRAQEPLDGVKPDFETRDLHGVTEIVRGGVAN